MIFSSSTHHKVISFPSLVEPRPGSAFRFVRRLRREAIMFPPGPPNSPSPHSPAAPFGHIVSFVCAVCLGGLFSKGPPTFQRLPPNRRFCRVLCNYPERRCTAKRCKRLHRRTESRAPVREFFPLFRPSTMGFGGKHCRTKAKRGKPPGKEHGAKQNTSTHTHTHKNPEKTISFPPFAPVPGNNRKLSISICSI